MHQRHLWDGLRLLYLDVDTLRGVRCDARHSVSPPKYSLCRGERGDIPGSGLSILVIPKLSLLIAEPRNSGNKFTYPHYANR